MGTSLFSTGTPAVTATANLDPWTSRPLTGNNDGDLGEGPNGSLYRWSSVVEEWKRDFIWDLADAGGGFVVDNKIDGDVTPANEDVAWTEVTGGGGTITSDGTRVSFDTTGANADLAEASYVHGQTGANHFQIGHARITNITGTNDYARWEIRTGDFDVLIDPAGIDLTAFVRAITTGKVEVGARHSNVTLATEKWVELYILRASTPATSEGTVWVFVDNSAAPVFVAPVTDFSASAVSQNRIGDNNSLASMLYEVREVKVGRWT